MNYEKLSKNALKNIYVSTALGTLPLLIPILLMNLFVFIPENIKEGKWVSAGIMIILLLYMLMIPYFRFHRYRYAINEECIDIKEGYFFVKRSIVPVERLHKLEMRRGPVDRMFKVTKLIVTTAGGDVTLRFLDVEKAEEIAEYLKKRINQIVKEQREEDGRE